MNYCVSCGSRYVDGTAWVRLNTWGGDKAGDDCGCDPPRDDAFCNNCEDAEARLTDDRREAAQARLDFRRENGPDAGVMQQIALERRASA